MLSTSLYVLLDDVVAKIGESVGRHSESRDDDSRMLDNIDNVNRRTMDVTREVVRQQFENFKTAKPLLDGLKQDYLGPEDPNAIPGWHSTDVLQRLDDELVRHVKQGGLPIPEGCEELRGAIEKDPDLPQNLKDKLFGGLRALESQFTLGEKMKETEEFKDIDAQKMTRLFLGGDKSNWDLEQYNQGSLSGLHRSFEHMLSTRDRELTGDYLEELQRIGTENSFALELQDTFKQSAIDMGIVDELLEQTRLPQGFRDGDTNLKLERGSVTEGGMKELQVLQQDSRYQLIVTSNDNIELRFQSMTQDECRARANTILDTYQQEIQNAQTDNDKRHVIGKSVQDLYRSHLFKDGNTRTIVVNLMNRMLLDNKLGPCALKDPKAAGASSLDEFVEHIRKGQENFQQLRDA
jgi:hypothetical protein